MNPSISSDADVNDYFDRIAESLSYNFGCTIVEAEELARQYYQKFTDPVYCSSRGVAVQDDDYFFHEGGAEMARKIYYHLVLKADARWEAYIKWRQNMLYPDQGL